MSSQLKSLQIEKRPVHFSTPRINPTNRERTIRLFLSQSPHPDSTGRRRTRLFGGEHDSPPSARELGDYLKLIGRIPPTADLVVLSEHPAASASLQTLGLLATANRQVIISALG